jgi:predicted nucleic acid-binding Zn ribbon protein
MSPKPREKQERSPEPTALGDIIAGLMKGRDLAGGSRIGRLAAVWTTVVGERLAAETAPVRLESGVLTVAATTGQWGSQARFLADEIMRNSNAELGSEEVRRVHVVVGQQAGSQGGRKGP